MFSDETGSDFSRPMENLILQPPSLQGKGERFKASLLLGERFSNDEKSQPIFARQLEKIVQGIYQKRLFFITLPVAAIASFVSIISTNTAQAQIIEDNSLGAESSVVNPDVSQGVSYDRIDGGAKRGANLFHSFKEFNVKDGQLLYFNNPAGITNIFSRVTGGNPSRILGLLGVWDNANQVLGNANLFLINPSGIYFGPNARLNVRGSFLASTADSLIFDNNFEFSASNPAAPPLLTVNIPNGLKFRDRPGNITNESTILQVPSGKTLALVGGDVTVNGGLTVAQGGRIELGGLATAGTVGLNNDGSLSFPEGFARGNVSLTNGAGVFVSSEGGGFITINARNFELSGGRGLFAGIIASGSPGAQAGDIVINATDKVRIEGGANSFTGISNQVSDAAQGNAGNIIINTGTLEGKGSFSIGSLTAGRGNAGKIIITASDKVSLEGLQDKFGGITSNVTQSGIGNAGDIIFNTPSLSLSKNAQIGTSTFGQGKAGNIIINASESVSVSGQSFLSAATAGKGNAGNIIIDSPNATISFDGKGTSASTSVFQGEIFGTLFVGAGKGGDINIKARSLTLNNGAQLSSNSLVQPGANQPATAGNIKVDVSDSVTLNGNSLVFANTTGDGNAGNIEIKAGSLLMTGQAQLSSTSTGKGNAGNILVQAKDTITLANENTLIVSNVGNPQGISAEGNVGNIQLEARAVSLTDNAQIQAGFYSNTRGNAGIVSIRADDSVSFVGGNSGIFTNVESGAVGNGSDIEIIAGGLVSFADGAVLEASNAGQGDGGNINIKAGSLSLNNDSDIFTNIFGRGNAGKVSIQADDSVKLANFSTISSNVNAGGEGIGGNIDIKARSLTLTDGSQIGATLLRAFNDLPGGKGKAGDITIDAKDFVNISGIYPSATLLNSSGLFTSAAKGTTATTPQAAGNITVTTGDFRVADGAVVNASTFNSGNAGNITINAKNFTATGGGQVFATTRSSGNAGNINLNISDRITLSGSDPNFNQKLEAADRAGESRDVVSSQGPASGIFANTGIDSTGKGGNLTVNTGELRVQDGATITVSSPQAQAGNLTINARTIRLNRGSLTAETAITRPGEEGANIKLQGLDLLSLRNNSLISAKATGTANGGNITIDVGNGFAIAFPRGDSDIIASASEGRGGNININAQSIFGLAQGRAIPGNLTNDIDASSQVGLSGTVDINTPETDPTQGLVELPETVQDPTQQIAQNPCQQGVGKEFVVTGRGGLPPSPNDVLNSDNTRVDLVEPVAMKIVGVGEGVSGGTKKNAAVPKPVVPAQGWVLNDKGEVVLTAYNPTRNDSQRSWQTSAACPAR
jgi:filamentous hemagglutinin family protein